MKTLTLFLDFASTTTLDSPGTSDVTFLADLLTIVVGALTIIGIIIVGIQYLTAPSGSPKIRQSKRHLLEIIIGFVIYASIYALLHYLLPHFID